MSLNMAALTKKGDLPAQKLAMVASMGLVADEAILLYRRMFPHERSSLLGVALVTEFIDGIRPEHLTRTRSNPCAEAVHGLGHKAAHRIVAARAGKLLVAAKLFVNRMARLLVRLSPDVPVAVEAEVRLFGHQQLFNPFVDRVATIT